MKGESFTIQGVDIRPGKLRKCHETFKNGQEQPRIVNGLKHSQNHVHASKTKKSHVFHNNTIPNSYQNILHHTFNLV